MNFKNVVLVAFEHLSLLVKEHRKKVGLIKSARRQQLITRQGVAKRKLNLNKTAQAFVVSL